MTRFLLFAFWEASRALLALLALLAIMAFPILIYLLGTLLGAPS